MQTTPYLRPTALQHMRGFLAEFGAGLPPWSTSDEVLNELVGLLHVHRDDDAFFARLAPFIQDLREHAQRGEAGLTARDAEVLSRSTVESIVEELQARLRGASRSASSSIVSALIGDRAARLLCLALLSSGLVACTQPAAPSTTPAEPGTPAPTPTPTQAKAADPQPAVAPESTDALVQMFKEKSPQEAAKALEATFDASEPVPPPPPGVDPAVAPQPVRVPRPHARYKGVDL
ncbi:MAG TPA: hypothetical protein VGK67_02585 [Myxococcales bacterium]|jgi:hypothetical protein